MVVKIIFKYFKKKKHKHKLKNQFILCLIENQIFLVDRMNKYDR